MQPRLLNCSCTRQFSDNSANPTHEKLRLVNAQEFAQNSDPKTFTFLDII